MTGEALVVQAVTTAVAMVGSFVLIYVLAQHSVPSALGLIAAWGAYGLVGIGFTLLKVRDQLAKLEPNND